MATIEPNTVETNADVSRQIDRRIKPWLWAVMLGAVFLFLGSFAVAGDVGGYGQMSSSVVGYLVYCFILGALFGGLLAYAARNVVKAIRC